MSIERKNWKAESHFVDLNYLGHLEKKCQGSHLSMIHNGLDTDALEISFNFACGNVTSSSVPGRYDLRMSSDSFKGQISG
jgi:hypothetical protein